MAPRASRGKAHKPKGEKKKREEKSKSIASPISTLSFLVNEGLSEFDGFGNCRSFKSALMRKDLPERCTNGVFPIHSLIKTQRLLGTFGIYKGYERCGCQTFCVMADFDN